MSFSNYLEDALLAQVFNGIPYIPPPALYVALFKTNPDEDGSGTEVSESGYLREEATFTIVSGGSVANNGEIVFDIAQEDWGSVTYGAVFDAPIAGNLLGYGILDTARDVITGDQVVIRDGSLVISLD